MTHPLAHVRAHGSAHAYAVAVGQGAFHDGISYDARVSPEFGGRMVVKAPGAAPQIGKLADFFTFTGDNKSMVRGPSGLLVPSATNTPRIEYDAAGAVIGLLIEESRTNLIFPSEAIGGASWANLGLSSVFADAIPSPSGAMTADKLVEDTTVGGAHRSRPADTAITANATYTLSCFVKAAQRTKCSLRLSDTTFTHFMEAHFDISAGTVGSVSNSGAATGATGRITPYINGWYRVSLAGAINAGATTARPLLELNDGGGALAYTGDGVSGLYAWGAQFEPGGAASSYVPTIGAAATRAADGCVRTLSTEFSPSVGSVAIAGRSSAAQSSAADQFVFSFDDTTTNERIGVFRISGTDTARLNIAQGGVLQVQLDGTFVNSTDFKLALAYALNDIAFCINGAAPATDVSAAVPAATKLTLGAFYGPSSGGNCYLKQFDYWPSRFSNPRLQALAA